MPIAPQLLLVGAVGAVGVLHTIVPDHWVPITLIARQERWTKRETGRAALVAGTGHTVSTLLIGLLVWIAGVAFATKFGTLASMVSSIALIAFGGWIAGSSLFELRSNEPAHRQQDSCRANPSTRASIVRASEPSATSGLEPAREHAHGDAHAPEHGHAPEPKHRRSARTALLLILGSSPMVEGIPAFFAAAKYGPGLIAVMAVVFAIATIATYVLLCVSSVASLHRVSLGPLERYGEVLSGAFIAIVGVVFLIFPLR